MKQRFHAVMKAAVDLMLEGHYVFSPISYNAPMEIHNLPTDWGFWQDYDKAFIRRCDALLILTIDGYKESVGVNAEIVEHGKEGFLCRNTEDWKHYLKQLLEDAGMVGKVLQCIISSTTRFIVKVILACHIPETRMIELGQSLLAGSKCTKSRYRARTISQKNSSQL